MAGTNFTSTSEANCSILLLGGPVEQPAGIVVKQRWRAIALNQASVPA